MRDRKLRITAQFGAMAPMPVGDVKIVKFADIRQAETELVCPSCGARPRWAGGYDCECGQKYPHWSRLKRILKATGQEILKVKFTEEKTVVQALAFVLPRKDFAERYSDATLEEKGIVAQDASTARNLMNLLIATQLLEKVIVVAYKDTYEERTCLLTLSMSNRVLLKEIIPMNILELEETMRADVSKVSQQELETAKKFVEMIPPPTEEIFVCHDYRAVGVEAAEKPSGKVVELEAILRQAEQRKLA